MIDHVIFGSSSPGIIKGKKYRVIEYDELNQRIMIEDESGDRRLFALGTHPTIQLLNKDDE